MRTEQKKAMSHSLDTERQRLIRTTGGFVLLGAGLIAVRAPVFAAGRKDAKDAKHDKDEEVTPPEDVMREHGVLDRVLLIYEAGMAKFSANEDFDPAVLSHFRVMPIAGRHLIYGLLLFCRTTASTLDFKRKKKCRTTLPA